MSLEKINEIDYIGIHKNTGKVKLSIIDDLNWNNEGEHLLLIQEKLNAYLRFIESGEIYEVYPKAVDRELEIVIYAKYEPVKKHLNS